MEIARQLLFLLLLIQLPISVQAEKMQLDLSLHNTGLDAGGNDDFKRGRAISLNFNYLLTQWLSLETGIFASNKTQDSRKSDIAGDFRANLATRTLALGLKPQYNFSSPFQLYARLGILYWETEIEIEEYFNEDTQGGIDSAEDSGQGYYAGIGAAYFITEAITLHFEYNRQQHLDLFDSRSNYPLDLEISSIAIGAGFHF